MDDKKKKVLTISFFVYAIVFLFAIIMMNFEKFNTFTTWLNDKLDIFTPIVLGAILAYLCNPLVRFFQQKILAKIKNNPLKRGLSILLAYLLLLCLVLVFVFMVFPQLISSIEDLMRKMTDGTYMNFALDKANSFLNNFLNIGDAQIINSDKINNLISKFFTGSEDMLQQGLNLLISYGAKIFTGIKNIFLGLLLSIYFIIEKERIYALCKKVVSAMFSKKKSQSIFDWCKFADKTFGGFVIGKILDALFMMLVCSIAFSIAGLPYAILISVVIGVFNIVPFFGPFIGAIPSGLIILIANPEKFILFVILTLVIQQIDANVIEPKIVGSRTGLSSLGVIVAIMIMSGYFGIIGMFFGVPIFAILYSLVISFVDKKLHKKSLSTELADYYSEDSIVDPRRERVPFSAKLFHFFGRKIVAGEHKIAEIFSKNNSSDDNADTTEETVNTEENNSSDNSNNDPQGEE